MADRKTQFFWASIAGAEPEPVEILERGNRKGIVTLGCEDTFWLDDEKAGIIIYVNELIRPRNFETQEQRDIREKTYLESRTQNHNWRGPR